MALIKLAWLSRCICVASLSLVACSTQSTKPVATKQSTSSALIPVYQGNRVWNGVTTTLDGKVFVSYPQADGPGIQLAELDSDGTPHPFPDARWNKLRPQRDVAHSFVHINAVRIGPDRALWVVDAGSPGIGKPGIPNAARVFRIDPATGRILQIYGLAAIKPLSYIDDIRFLGDTAYLTDAGAPGLILLTLSTGETRRVLDKDPSTIDARSMHADGKLLRDEKGKELRVHADQLEVSPDGAWLYYQPASGPMSRISTHALNDPTLSPVQLAAQVQPWVNTPTTGGTAIDAAGNLYVADTDKRQILKIGPDRKTTTLIADPRLVWSDAMWIDSQGYLWMPATQQNLTRGFNNGQMAVNYPVWIYKMKVDAMPSPIDHQ